MNKKILFLILLSILIFPAITFADTPALITNIMDATVNTVLYVASAIVVIIWVVTGVLFLTAQGAPEKLTSAKKALIAAVVGTVIVIIAVSAINLVGSAFGLNGSSSGESSDSSGF